MKQLALAATFVALTVGFTLEVDAQRLPGSDENVRTYTPQQNYNSPRQGFGQQYNNLGRPLPRQEPQQFQWPTPKTYSPRLPGPRDRVCRQVGHQVHCF